MEDTSSTLPEAISHSASTRRSRLRSVFMFVIAPLIVVALLLGLCLSPLGRGLLMKAIRAETSSPSQHHTAPTISLAEDFANCPASGQVRAAVMLPLAHGNDQSIVYVTNKGARGASTSMFLPATVPSLAQEGLSNAGSIPTTIPISSTLTRYDITIGRPFEIAKFAQVTITNARLTADGQWVLFTTNTNKRSALQTIRLDGQGLQTLYCTSTEPFNNVRFTDSPMPYNDIVWSPDRQAAVLVFAKNNFAPGFTLSLLNIRGGTLRTLYHTINQVFEDVQWSPDQKSVALSVSAPYPANTSTVLLVKVENGTVQTAVSFGFHDAFLPVLRWLDATHIYLMNATEYADTLPDTLYMLDLSRGLNQHRKDLITLFQQTSWQHVGNVQANTFGDPCWDQTTSNDSSMLLISQCSTLGYFPRSSGDQVLQGPSSISVQPAKGGPARTIYSSKTLAVIAIESISSTGVVFLIDDGSSVAKNPVDTSQNGLWKVNTDGSGLIRLTTDQDKRPDSFVAFSAGSNFYAIEVERGGVNISEMILFGASNGSTLQTVASASDGTTLSLVGWTRV